MRLRLLLLFLLASVDAFSNPIIYNPFHRLPAAAASSIESIDTTAIVASLHRKFPAFTQHHPVHASVLSLLDSLATAPSCQRTATTGFVSKCGQLSNTSPTASLSIKLQYAVRLAVCEFEATGVAFPPECANLDDRWGQYAKTRNEKKRVQHCLKKLEERPQWWTTLSNNLQNAVVICAAVRHEVEEDELLDLYRNITKVQQGLFDAMDTSLQQTWAVLSEQKKWSATWKADMGAMQDEMQEAGRVTSQSLAQQGDELRQMLEEIQQHAATSLNKEFAELGEVIKVTRSLRYHTEELVTGLDQASAFSLRALESIANASKAQISSLLKLMEETGKSMLDGLRKGSVEISSELVNQIQQFSKIFTDRMQASASSDAHHLGEKLQGYQQLVTAIAISHAHIVEAQESLFTTLKEHEEAQQRLQHSMDLAAPKFEAVVERLLGSAEALGKTLDETEIRVQKLGFQRQFWSPLGLCAVGLLLLLGVDREKIVAGAWVVTATFLVFSSAPELAHIVRGATVMLWTNPMNMTEKSAAVGLGALMAEPTRVVEQQGWKLRHALGEVFPVGLYCILLFGTLFLVAFLVFQYLQRVKVPVQLQLPTQTQKN